MLKVQFGSGSNLLPGWENRDSDCDITKPLPYASRSVDEVLAEHVCEHVSGPSFVKFLLECRRILKNGGKLWIAMPVIDHLSHDHALDILLNHGHECGYTEELIFRILYVVFDPAEITRLKSDKMSDRPEIFGHHKVIGESKDHLESARFLVTI
jgi:predicted SAM-dependent methyltransferase